MKHVTLVLLPLFLTLTNATAANNTTITSYDPGELLSRIFNPNNTIQSRQRGYGFIKFEGQSDPDIDPDYQSNGKYIDPERPLRFEEHDDENHAYYEPYYDPNQNSNGRPIKFEGEFGNTQDFSLNNDGQITFQDENKVDDQVNNKKKKRKRRRKPKNGVLPYPAANFDPGRPGFQGTINDGYGVDPYAYPAYQYGQPFRRPRRPRPRPSLASAALSSVIDALTSIARYDDYQCVPRLLCEAAGGGTLSSNGVLQSVAGIQPLLAMLSAYNGISSSPLFVFGRGVFLGMTSKGNIGTCRYAYPECPTDPEELIFYLNNYNGGFFRFFSAPQNPPSHQNLEQFYNQLGQNPQDFGNYPYNPQNPDAGQGYYPHQQSGYPRPYGNENPENYASNYNRPSLYTNQNYGSNYAYDYNNYGSGNRIKFKDSNSRIEKRIQSRPGPNLIDDSSEDDSYQSKWLFPDNAYENGNGNYNSYKIRDSGTMRFPDGTPAYYNNQNDYIRKGKVINFPEYSNNIHYNNRYNFDYNRYETTTYSYNSDQNNQNYYNNRPNAFTNNNNNYRPIKYYSYNENPTKNDYQNNNNNYPNYNNDNYYQPGNKYTNQNNNYHNNQNYYNNQQNMYNNNQKYPTTVFNNEEYTFDYKHNFYVKKDNYNNNFKRAEDDGLKTVYVVRGHGDPNRPEVVKLRPGQSIH